ncbi:MAG: Peptidoglycan glycosyltransferase [Candidatus Uhrbacteria bacterium GW2011_GWD2_52_7]|uniref:Peptidoglycan glycosyltransferase n=1 Tax=Candidatus Uhrbacteria bacterium GW2011_GWD2_52_7 TaxID=1618989 RepID=A0A0G1ZMR1_9BACT|nr:MAG: Peptidoglycan glycosyltransferase [Candidatus Uhrbacteria bacterium GW2011_GWD2_52_7]
MVGGLRKRGMGSGRRLSALRFFFVGFCGVIVIRLFILQVVSASFYTALAEGQYSLYEELVPERGEIYVKDEGDETEYSAATDEPRAFVFADPRRVTDPKTTAIRIARALGWEGIEDYEHQQLIAELAAAGRNDEVAALLAIDQEQCAQEDESQAESLATADEGVDDVTVADPVPPCVTEASDEQNQVTQLIERLSKQDDPYEPVARNVEQSALDRLLELEIDGLSYVLEDARAYPERGLGGHLFGFVGRDEEGKPVGRYGLEGYFEDFLAGSAGSLYSQADGAGRWIGVGDRSFAPAIDGGDLLLTIDRHVQYTACGMLRNAVERFSADGGALVIVEPSTGAIIAMCGAPDFEPSEYAQVDDISVYNNPTIFTAYEPGSIFKPFTLAAGIDSGAITPNTLFTDTGSVRLDDRTIRNAADHVYGLVDMTTALEESVNTAMVYAMMQTGKDVFTEYVRNFGFGTITGVTLNSEVAGTTESLDKSGDIFAATASFGQGITVTPLQVAMAYAAIANGGVLMEPYVVEEMRYPDGTVEAQTPTKVRQVISSTTATTVAAMLVSVVEEGHGKRAGVPGYWIAGKTGTAQIAKNGVYSATEFNGSFAGFGPVQDPRFAMIVKIENPKSENILYAESTAAPVFGEIADYLLEYYAVAPDRPVD